MNLKQFSLATLAAATFACSGTHLLAQGQPPPTTHGNDLLWGRDGGGGTPNFGATGTGTAFWFADSATNPNRPAQFLAAPIMMIPNINAPDSDPATLPSPGGIYYNLGTNEVYTNGGLNGTLRTGTFVGDYVSPGLEIWKSQYRFFAPVGTPTAVSETFPYPYTGTWHNHLAARAFRPGTYTFKFHLANVVAYDYTNLTDSPIYTMTLQSRPVLTGKANLSGWTKVDTSRNLTGNRARVFIFAKDSTPANETDALDYTDVYLDNAGAFAVPEGLNITDGQPYRVGIKPLTAYGIAKLLPGNITLSTATPANVGTVNITLGDANRDGVIDIADFGALVNAYGNDSSGTGYNPAVDFSGDGIVDIADFGILVNGYGNVADFMPAS